MHVRKGNDEMKCNMEILLQDIEELREKLSVIVQLNGMTNCKTIEVSQSLDHLLNEYDKIKNKSRISG